MSSGKTLKWLKNKSLKDYKTIDLKTPYVPETNFYSAHDHKPVMDISGWATRHIEEARRRSSHEIAEALWRVAEKHPGGHPWQAGQYFEVQYSSTAEDHTVLSPRCIIGALILELPNGKAIARDIVRYGKNRAGIGGILPLRPAAMRDPDIRMALTQAQRLNDQGMSWEGIAWRFSSQVGYSRPQKRAA